MVLNYFGDGCFRLQSGDTSILIDPTNNRLKADLVLRTLAPTGAEELAALASDAGDATAISFPGEYEVKGIEVTGMSVAGESTEKNVKTAYLVVWEEMRFVFLGHIGKPLDASMMEEFAEPDVLFLPVGGKEFLEPEVAAKIAKQLEAKVVVPSFCKNPDEFLKALGKKAEQEEKFVFKQKDIATDKGRAVILKAS